jgi:hypothetical protein
LVERVVRAGEFRDTVASAPRVNRRLAEVVRRTIDDRRLPIVLSGSCNSLRVLAAEGFVGFSSR